MPETKVIELISEIIKIREKYEHLAEISYPIWKQRFENDKNNLPHQSVIYGGENTEENKIKLIWDEIETWYKMSNSCLSWQQHEILKDIFKTHSPELFKGTDD